MIPSMNGMTVWHQPAELGFGLNVPDTISPRLEEEFPLDLLLQWCTANRKREERNVIGKQVAMDCVQAAHKISLKYLHSQTQRREMAQASNAHHYGRGRHTTSLTHHPSWWKILRWPRFRPTSERPDHTTLLGFHPPPLHLPTPLPGLSHP